MIGLTTNNGAVRALQSLTAAQKAMSATQAKLSTGHKVDSAKDDGAAFVISKHIQDQQSEQSVLHQNQQRVKSLLDVTQSAATNISDLVSQMKEKVLAWSDPSIDTASRNALQTDIQALSHQVDQVSQAASFNGTNLLAPTNSTQYFSSPLTALQTAGSASFTAPSSEAGGQIEILYNLVNVHSMLFSYDDHLGNATNVPITVPGSLNGSIVQSYQYGPAATSQSVDYGFSSTPYTTPGATGISVGWVRFVPGEQSTRVNVYSGDTLELVHKPMSAAALGVDNLTSLTPNQALAAVDNALNKTDGYAAYYGGRQNIVDGLLKQSSTMDDIYTQGYGDIVDADMAKESANWQAQQAKLDLATQALQIANQAPKMLLDLFRG